MLRPRGEADFDRGEAESALKFLARAAERKPDHAMLQLSLGRALFEQGNYAFADQAFANAQSLQPDLSTARLYRARVRMRARTTNESSATPLRALTTLKAALTDAISPSHVRS